MIEAGFDSGVKIGVSTCLLGKNVRYDGGHKRDSWIVDTLSKHVELIPVCPEHECGLPIPRESMHLEGDLSAPRLITTKTRQDISKQMRLWIDEKLPELAEQNLDGFVFKTKSPSSGLSRIKYFQDGKVTALGPGIFAKAFVEAFPLLPVEDEGRLYNSEIRENFVQRIFVVRRWKNIMEGRPTIGKLIKFHTVHKLLILSHSEKLYREMGKLVGNAASIPIREACDAYYVYLMKALKLSSSIKKNVNVLQHIQGHFKKYLSTDEKNELQEIFIKYQKCQVPLIVPITLINHYIRKFSIAYLNDQIYLNRFPDELALLNHV